MKENLPDEQQKRPVQTQEVKKVIIKLTQLLLSMYNARPLNNGILTFSWGHYYWHLHFKDEETMMQKDYTARLRPQSVNGEEEFEHKQ